MENLPQTMKAVIKEKPGQGFTLTDVPVPLPGPHEVLIRVTAASICGTDALIDAWAHGRRDG